MCNYHTQPPSPHTYTHPIPILPPPPPHTHTHILTHPHTFTQPKITWGKKRRWSKLSKTWKLPSMSRKRIWSSCDPNIKCISVFTTARPTIRISRPPIRTIRYPTPRPIRTIKYSTLIPPVSRRRPGICRPGATLSIPRK